MLIYEVNLEVNESVKFKYAGWLPSHLEKMLKFRGFRHAYWFYRDPQIENLAENLTLWTIHYIVDDIGCLNEYLQGPAKEMRQETIDLFGDQFKATRRILTPLAGAGIDKETSA